MRPLRKRPTREPPKCSFEGCTKVSYCKGYCAGHYWQLYHGRKLTPLREKASKFHMQGPCSVPECSLPLKAKGLCDKHYLVSHKYNISPAKYEEMRISQGDRCAICGTSDPGGKGTWHIDHDHSCCPEKGRSCGKCVRNLLCNACNTGLGLFRDDTDRLTAAIAYLESHGKKAETATA